MKSGEWVQIFHTDDVTYSGLLALLIGESKFSTNQKHYPHLGSVEWTVWNFCACSPNIISRWNCWCRREMSAVFSGSTSGGWYVFKSVKTEEYNWSDSLLPENENCPVITYGFFVCDELLFNRESVYPDMISSTHIRNTRMCLHQLRYGKTRGR